MKEKTENKTSEKGFDFMSGCCEGMSEMMSKGRKDKGRFFDCCSMMMKQETKEKSSGSKGDLFSDCFSMMGKMRDMMGKEFRSSKKRKEKNGNFS